VEVALVRATVSGDRLAVASRDGHSLRQRVLRLRIADTHDFTFDGRENRGRGRIRGQDPGLVLHGERLRRRLQRAIRRARIAGEDRNATVDIQLIGREGPDARTRPFLARIRHVDDVPIEAACDGVGGGRVCDADSSIAGRSWITGPAGSAASVGPTLLA